MKLIFTPHNIEKTRSPSVEERVCHIIHLHHGVASQVHSHIDEKRIHPSHRVLDLLGQPVVLHDTYAGYDLKINLNKSRSIIFQPH